jgi:hypothetical protein
MDIVPHERQVAQYTFDHRHRPFRQGAATAQGTRRRARKRRGTEYSPVDNRRRDGRRFTGFMSSGADNGRKVRLIGGGAGYSLLPLERPGN